MLTDSRGTTKAGQVEKKMRLAKNLFYNIKDLVAMTDCLSRQEVKSVIAHGSEHHLRIRTKPPGITYAFSDVLSVLQHQRGNPFAQQRYQRSTQS